MTSGTGKRRKMRKKTVRKKKPAKNRKNNPPPARGRRGGGGKPVRPSPSPLPAREGGERGRRSASPDGGWSPRPVALADVQPDDSPRWLIQDIWAWQGTGVLSAAPKCGKTWLALGMAVAVASGTPFLGRYPVNRRGPALLISPEMSDAALAARIGGIVAGRGLDPAVCRDIHIDTRPGLLLDRREHRGSLLRTALDLRPGLIVIDPLSACYGGSENSAAHLRPVVEFLQTLARETGAGVVLVHHVASRKNKPGFGGRGSGHLFAFGESYIALKPHHQPGKHIEFQTRQRHGESVQLLLRSSAGGLDPVEEQAELRVMDEIKRFLGGRPGACHTEIRESVTGKTALIGQALKDLRAGGRIVRDERGGYFLVAGADVPADVPGGHTHIYDGNGDGARVSRDAENGDVKIGNSAPGLDERSAGEQNAQKCVCVAGTSFLPSGCPQFPDISDAGNMVSDEPGPIPEGVEEPPE